MIFIKIQVSEGFPVTFMTVAQMKASWYFETPPKSPTGLLQTFQLVSWKSVTEKGEWHPLSLGRTHFLSVSDGSRIDTVAYLPSLPSGATVPGCNVLGKEPGWHACKPQWPTSKCIIRVPDSGASVLSPCLSWWWGSDTAMRSLSFLPVQSDR